MSDALTQTVRVAIRRSDVAPSFVEEEREVTVSPSTTLGQLLQVMALRDRYPHVWNWTFTANGQPVRQTEQIGDLCEALRATNYRDGILWLDLLYIATPGPPEGEWGGSDRSATPGSAAPPAPVPAPAPAVAPPDHGAFRSTTSLGKTVAEFKKGLKGIKDEGEYRYEKAKRSSETVKRSSERRATVRYYTRMNPDRMFPLLVILSQTEIAEIVKAKVKQAVSEAFKVEEGSAVEVEPVLPGCDCYPPRHTLAIDAKDAITETFWVVPRVLGRVHGARVLIRQGDRVLADVPLDVKVAKQTLAVACGLLSLAAPYMTMGLKSLRLDYESQKADGFPLYQQAGNWIAENLRPEWLGLGFLGLAFVLYLWMRPRRRDVFWDIQPAKP